MNRFDRVTAVWLLLQTRRVVTASYLAEHFGVSERTVYRDIRSLENAGVPIGAEAGIGYFLEQGYRLPPVSFTVDEAAALLLGEKLVSSGLDAHTRSEFKLALGKIRAVVDQSVQDDLSSLEADVAVLPSSHAFPAPRGEHSSLGNTDPGNAAPDADDWLREARLALMRRQVVDIEYLSQSCERAEARSIEPIGLFHYSWHWHLISWCRLRGDYRDFRLDRIHRFSPTEERFNRHSRLSLQQYLAERPGAESFEEIVLLFSHEAARFVDEQRFLFGFVDECVLNEGVEMRFLTAMPDYMARWLLQFLDHVEVVSGQAMEQLLSHHSERLIQHWRRPR